MTSRFRSGIVLAVCTLLLAGGCKQTSCPPPYGLEGVGYFGLYIAKNDSGLNGTFSSAHVFYPANGQIRQGRTSSLDVPFSVTHDMVKLCLVSKGTTDTVEVAYTRKIERVHVDCGTFDYRMIIVNPRVVYHTMDSFKVKASAYAQSL